MKTNLVYAAVVGGALCVGLLLNTQKVAAATGSEQGSNPGAPPIGKLVDVTVVSWPLSTQAAVKFSGTLVSMQPNWLVVSDGSYDHWIPTEKVMAIKASK